MELKKGGLKEIDALLSFCLFAATAAYSEKAHHFFEQNPMSLSRKRKRAAYHLERSRRTSPAIRLKFNALSQKLTCD